MVLECAESTASRWASSTVQKVELTAQVCYRKPIAILSAQCIGTTKSRSLPDSVPSMVVSSPWLD